MKNCEYYEELIGAVLDGEGVQLTALRPAEDAIVVDTSYLDFQQSKEKILEIIREKVGL